MLKQHAILLFQGDSITDADRTAASDPKSALGTGYPSLIKGYLDIFCPEKNVQVINRGVSGNRTIDLVNRWDEDCIGLKPDCLTILIGVNDTWRKYDSDSPTSAEEYEKNLRTILERSTRELSCDIVLLEPFLIPADPQKDCWREDLDPKIHAARRLAREFGVVYIPLDGVFASSCTTVEPKLLAEDGVHPTHLGHSIIAKLWLDVML